MAGQRGIAEAKDDIETGRRLECRRIRRGIMVRSRQMRHWQGQLENQRQRRYPARRKMRDPVMPSVSLQISRRLKPGFFQPHAFFPKYGPGDFLA